jgi:hypothetical protein
MEFEIFSDTTSLHEAAHFDKASLSILLHRWSAFPLKSAASTYSALGSGEQGNLDLVAGCSGSLNGI